jgi:hypothetical protein
VQVNLPPRRVLPQEFRGRQVEFRGIQDRTVAVVTQLFVALDDAVPKRVQPGYGVVDVHEDAVRRQILEKMGGALEEQGQKVFDAAGRNPGTHVAVDRLLRQIAGEPQPVAAAEFAHRVGIKRRLARGQQLDSIQLVRRALRVRIEAPDAVHVAVQHVDPIRSVRAHRKDVNQRSA